MKQLEKWGSYDIILEMNALAKIWDSVVHLVCTFNIYAVHQLTSTNFYIMPSIIDHFLNYKKLSAVVNAYRGIITSKMTFEHNVAACFVLILIVEYTGMHILYCQSILFRIKAMPHHSHQRLCTKPGLDCTDGIGLAIRFKFPPIQSNTTNPIWVLAPFKCVNR